MSEGKKSQFAHAHVVAEHYIMCHKWFQELEDASSNVYHAVFEFSFAVEWGWGDLMYMNSFPSALAVV